MQKKLFIAGFLVLVIICSLTAISASDINQTDSCDDSLQIDNLTAVEETSNPDDSVNAERNQTELSAPSTSISYKGSYSVVLKDSNSSALISNRTVNFIINEVNYTATTDDNGVASVQLDLKCGKYLATAIFEGDSEYQNSTLSKSIEITSPIKAKDITKYYKASTKFTAQFFDTSGKILANRAVSITVNGKPHSVKTNSKGVASLAVNLKPGKYKIVSTDSVTGFKLTTTFTVLATITSTKLKKVEGEKFTAKFLKSNGKPLAKKYVKIKFKGKTYKVKTNSKGVAGVSLKNVKKGTYKVVCYNKDGFSKTFKVKVFKRKASTKLTAKSYTFLPKDKKVIKVKLTTALGNGYSSGKTIKITVNGKTYSRKTDSTGVASLSVSSVKKGIYKVQYKFSGNKYYKSSKSSKSLTIYDTTKTKISVKSTTHFGYGAGTLMKLAYTAGGVPLAKKTVKLNISGKTYSKTTDKSGMVSVPINLKIGSYTVSYNTENKSGFSGTSGSFSIDVFQRSPSKIVWKCKTSFKDNSQTFKVLVTNSNGAHVSGGKIELTIDGETYTSTVASNGYAKFKTEVPVGKYKVSVKYKGNNNYLSSSTSKTINVALSKYGNGINEKNAKAIRAYLKSSSHCKVGTKAIKKLVKSITKGLTNDLDRAKAIFDYARDALEYSFYYDTKYGASGTLKHKAGNCVDLSHALVAMYRTAGFSARYVHGTCRFSDGDITGHVWCQVKVGNKWICADASNNINYFGKIKSWNTKNYRIHGKYASLSF